MTTKKPPAAATYRSSKTGQFASKAPHRNALSIEKQIQAFYKMDKKKAAKAVKESGILTDKGRLRAVFK